MPAYSRPGVFLQYWYRLDQSVNHMGNADMKQNIGTTDRILRIVIGAAILSLTLILEGDVRWWGLIGIVPIATALFGYCPPYALLGINTRGGGQDTAAK